MQTQKSMCGQLYEWKDQETFKFPTNFAELVIAFLFLWTLQKENQTTCNLNKLHVLCNCTLTHSFMQMNPWRWTHELAIFTEPPNGNNDLNTEQKLHCLRSPTIHFRRCKLRRKENESFQEKQTLQVNHFSSKISQTSKRKLPCYKIIVITEIRYDGSWNNVG